MLGILMLFTIVELLFFVRIFNHDKIYGIFFGILILYTCIPAYARIFDNDFVNLISHVTVNGNGIVLSYAIYSFLFLVSCFLGYIFVLEGSITKGKRIKTISITFGGLGPVMYRGCEWLVICYLFINYILHRGELNYYNQAAVKGNIIWYLLLEFVLVFVLIDILYEINKGRKRVHLSSLIPSVLMVAIMGITCVKIGNRGIFVPAMTGIFYLILTKMDIKISLSGIKKWIKPLVFVFLIIIISQYVRVNRGHDTNLFTLKNALEFFKLDSFLFQDYTYPGNSLMYCMMNGLIEPDIVLKSNLCNAIFFLDFPTIAGYLSSNYIAVGQWFGIGGLITVEGYFLAGWLGFIIIPIIIVFFYKLYYALFFRTEDRNFTLFAGVIITAFVSFNLVRGQTYLLIKVLYMYFLPAILLYNMKFERKKNA